MMDSGIQLEYRDTDQLQLWNWMVVKEEGSMKPSPSKDTSGYWLTNRKEFSRAARPSTLEFGRLKCTRIIRKVNILSFLIIKLKKNRNKDCGKWHIQLYIDKSC